MQLTTRWKTSRETCFDGAVSIDDQNRAAHGGVCLWQVRRTRFGRVQGRRVNVNGMHTEESPVYDLSESDFGHWHI
jgi:hypothetical protein